jgi:hypothetical protein
MESMADCAAAEVVRGEEVGELREADKAAVHTLAAARQGSEGFLPHTLQFMMCSLVS